MEEGLKCWACPSAPAPLEGLPGPSRLPQPPSSCPVIAHFLASSGLRRAGSTPPACCPGSLGADSRAPSRQVDHCSQTDRGTGAYGQGHKEPGGDKDRPGWGNVRHLGPVPAAALPSQTRDASAGRGQPGCESSWPCPPSSSLPPGHIQKTIPATSRAVWDMSSDLAPYQGTLHWTPGTLSHFSRLGMGEEGLPAEEPVQEWRSSPWAPYRLR